MLPAIALQTGTAMNDAQAWIGHAGTLALTVALAGILARRRYRVWIFLALFLAVTLASTIMMLASPTRFYTTSFWQVKETALNLLRFGMAIELAYRTFRAFPGAHATVRWALLLVLVTTLVAVVAISGGGSDFRSFVADLQPRVLNGSIWLFTAIAALILWYRLPVDPFHKVVLLSYVPFLLVFTVTLNALGSLGWERGWSVTYLYQLSYLALMVHWARAAWRRVEEPARPPALRTGVREAASA
jgi:hypothetical protein